MIWWPILLAKDAFSNYKYWYVNKPHFDHLATYKNNEQLIAWCAIMEFLLYK